MRGKRSGQQCDDCSWRARCWKVGFNVGKKCCDKFCSSDDTFVFLHAVDTYPGSTDLEQMLFRLQKNIDTFLKDSPDLSNAEDLRSKHITRLTSVAEKNPDKKFIFVIDAVNHSMGAWLMWWLPGEEDNVPLNVRFIVSTLIKENNTYHNALKRCPSVKPITVSDMSKEDREVMVREKLGKFCKKLSTENNFLKNQMDMLLEKNSTPLYLSAACEYLRTAGIFKK